MKKPLLIPEKIKEHFGYCPFTGDVFRKAIVTSFVNTDGYISVTFNRRKYKAHRVAWFLLYDEQPPQIVDHIDRNKTNNRISNLRGLTAKQNSRNTKKCFIAVDV